MGGEGDSRCTPRGVPVGRGQHRGGPDGRDRRLVSQARRRGHRQHQRGRPAARDVQHLAGDARVRRRRGRRGRHQRQGGAGGGGGAAGAGGERRPGGVAPVRRGGTTGVAGSGGRGGTGGATATGGSDRHWRHDRKRRQGRRDRHGRCDRQRRQRRCDAAPAARRSAAAVADPRSARQEPRAVTPVRKAARAPAATVERRRAMPAAAAASPADPLPVPSPPWRGCSACSRSRPRAAPKREASDCRPKLACVASRRTRCWRWRRQRLERATKLVRAPKSQQRHRSLSRTNYRPFQVTGLVSGCRFTRRRRVRAPDSRPV